jgi:hypothetical protein
MKNFEIWTTNKTSLMIPESDIVLLGGKKAYVYDKFVVWRDNYEVKPVTVFDKTIALGWGLFRDKIMKIASIDSKRVKDKFLVEATSTCRMFVPKVEIHTIKSIYKYFNSLHPLVTEGESLEKLIYLK